MGARRKHIAIIAGICGLLVTIYYDAGYLLVRRARSLYSQKDCTGLLTIAGSVQQIYPAVIAPFVETITADTDECRAYVDASEQFEGQSWEKAHAGFVQYLERYPSGLFASEASARALDSELEWGKSLLEQGAYEMALEKFDEVLAKHPDYARAQEAYEGAARARILLADRALDSHQYETAIVLLQTVSKDYPDATASAEVASGVPEALLAWARDLGREGGYLAALDKLDEARKAPGAASLVPEIEEEQGRLIEALARDEGADGSQILKQTMQELCYDSLPAPSHPAVGLFKETAGKMLACDDEEFLTGMAQNLRQWDLHYAELLEKSVSGPDWLPADLAAASPGEVRYTVFRLNDFQGSGVYCYYTGRGGLTDSIEIMRPMAYIQVFDAFSGESMAEKEFRGETPAYACPKTKTYTGEGELHFGEEGLTAADEARIIDWLRGLDLH